MTRPRPPSSRASAVPRCRQAEHRASPARHVRLRNPCPRRSGSTHRRGAAADAVHALRLPRLRQLCPGRGLGRGRHQPVPPRGRCGSGEAGCTDGPARCPAERRARHGSPAHRGRDRRGLVHRLHPVHQGLPHGCHPGRQQVHAYGDRRPLHGLRAVHPRLSRGLHRAAQRQRPGHRLVCLEPPAGRACAPALCAAPRA